MRLSVLPSFTHPILDKAFLPRVRVNEGLVDWSCSNGLVDDTVKTLCEERPEVSLILETLVEGAFDSRVVALLVELITASQV